ncbi:MAG: hypothetical protein PHC83_00585, partial [Bacteroidales bacterium]|nr:hypothetical protein [Bacteroidales bacterium]
QACSTNEKDNEILKNTPQKKRQLQSEKDASSYSYKLASIHLKKRFLKTYNWDKEVVEEEQ